MPWRGVLSSMSFSLAREGKEVKVQSDPKINIPSLPAKMKDTLTKISRAKTSCLQMKSETLLPNDTEERVSPEEGLGLKHRRSQLSKQLVVRGRGDEAFKRRREDKYPLPYPISSPSDRGGLRLKLKLGEGDLEDPTT